VSSRKPALRVAWEAAGVRRLFQHGLVTAMPEGTDPSVVAAATSGLHAQVISAGEASGALRINGATRDTIRCALWRDRSLVKTFGPRGTVHLLAAGDLHRWTGALAAVPWRSPFPDDVRLTPAQTDRVLAALDQALREAELTVDELSEAVVSMAGPWAGDLVMPAFQGMWPRWRQALTTAAYAGVLCYGPDRDRRVTYTHPSRWVPEAPAMDSHEAISWLVQSYLRSYGPATAQSFAQWLGAPTAWATTQLETRTETLAVVELDGMPAWDLPDASYDASPAPEVRLLPYFDAFVVGSQPRARLFPGPAAGRALTPSGQAGNYPVLLLDGVVGGVWHQRQRSGRRMDVTVEPLRRLSARHLRCLKEQVVRIGEIFGKEATLTVGPVTVGPHA
jgi:uncharacterized protein YukE